MSAQHTPGPWFIQAEHHPMKADGTRDEPLAIHDAHGARVAILSDETSQLANARLIAAAPELLDLAYQYLSDLRRPPQGDSLQRRIERAEAIIAKAQGQ